MYYVVFVYDYRDIDVYQLNRLDDNILMFLKEANKILDGTGILVFEGELLSSLSFAGEIFIQNIMDIEKNFSIFEDEMYEDDEIQREYYEICTYIKKIFNNVKHEKFSI